MLCRLFKVSHDGPCVVDENFRKRCGSNATRPSFEKRGSQGLLNLAQSPADRWLGYVEVSGRADDAALFGDGQHQDEVANFEWPVQEGSDVHADDDMPI